MKFFRDTSISNKILIPPAITMVALGIVLLLAIHGFKKQGSVLTQVHDIALERITLVNEFMSLSESVQSDLFRVTVLRMMNIPEPEIQSIHEHLGQGLSDIMVIYRQILSKWPLDHEEKKILEQMKVPMDAFSEEARQATEVVLQDPSFGIFLVRSAAVPFADFQRLLSQFLNYQKRKIAYAETASRETVEKVETTILFIAFFTAFIAILISVWIGNRLISRPVRSITDAMGQLAGGNLSTGVGDLNRKDEIGSMAKAVEVFRENAFEKRTAEEALKASEVNYQTIFDTANDAFFIHDLNTGQILDVNQKMHEMYGYTVEEARHIDVEVLSEGVPPYSQEEAMAWIQKAAEGTPQLFEWKAKHKTGEVFWVEVNLKRITIGNEDRLLAIARDITERKLAEEERIKLEDKLHRAQKMESLGLMAGGIAHDLNNILSGIVSYPELLLMDIPVGSPMRKPMETIKESGMRAVDVVSDLITIARGVASTKEALNFNTIVAEYLGSAEHQKLERTHSFIDFKVELNPDLLNSNGSSTHIKKILMNLVMNASEAIEGAGIVTISTENRYLDEPLEGYEDVRIGEYAVLSVSDDGSGIPAANLEKIFEPFYTKNVMGRSGTGLGLAVVWNSVQEHNGYINVKSGEKGTVFELYFPVTREEVAGAEAEVPLEDYFGQGEKILVVDDEERQREIACGMLTKLGYIAEAVSSGEEAIEYVKEHPVDLIVLDMVMPKGINGRKTYEEIIKIRPKQKAIIASGYAKTKEVDAAQELGAGKYIKKPYTLEKVGLAVKEELEK